MPEQPLTAVGAVLQAERMRRLTTAATRCERIARCTRHPGQAANGKYNSGMHLQLIDWLIVLATLLICFVPALFFGKRAGKNTSEFFVSGRAVPWWLAGLSMVATTFSSDTPNLVTDIVRQKGVAGNWVWWAFVLTGVATVFFYARMWRRSEVMTDLEFYEIRYSGTAASVVRGFRSVYLGLFFNCVILASVSLAACKIANILFGLPRWQTLLLCGVLNVAFAAHSGLWGVLVIDMIQFFIKMTAVIAAAFFAVQHVGGLHVMVEKLSAPMLAPDGKTMLHYLNVLPDFKNNWDMAVAVFVMPIAVQWWATWYPGAEPGGGSYIAQRMLASKSEKDSLGAVLFFNVAHYVLRPWPWILVGLCSLLVYPELSDIQKAFPNLDPKLFNRPDPFELGVLLPRARLLSTLRAQGRLGETLRVCGPADDHRPVRVRQRRGVSAGLGQVRFRHHSPGGRGHGVAISAALVLVAHQCLVRSGGDDQLVRCLAAPVNPQDAVRRSVQHALRAADHHCCHHRLLDVDGLCRAANRPPKANRVLPEGAPVWPRLEAHSPGSGHFRTGSRRHA